VANTVIVWCIVTTDGIADVSAGAVLSVLDVSEVTAVTENGVGVAVAMSDAGVAVVRSDAGVAVTSIDAGMSEIVGVAEAVVLLTDVVSIAKTNTCELDGVLVVKSVVGVGKPDGRLATTTLAWEDPAFAPAPFVNALKNW
jgi:hypothetical protein